MSFDHLQKSIKTKKCPLAVCLGAAVNQIPPHLLHASFETCGETLEGAAQALLQFDRALIDALQDTVPAVLVRVPHYETLGWQGIRAMEETIRYARGKGLFVIADVQSGDTAAAHAYLGKVQVGGTALPIFDADCVTLNGYPGSDTILPFWELCRKADKCFFLLVRSPNPSAGEIQDLMAGDRVVYQAMGDLLQRLDREAPGTTGYGRAGAMVGLPYPSDLRALRKRLEHAFFLVTNYGQDLAAEDARFAFDQYGRGALLSDGGACMKAWQLSGSDGTDFPETARTAAQALRDNIKQYVTFL